MTGCFFVQWTLPLFFSAFDWDQSAKIYPNGWKNNALKSAKLPCLKVICWKRTRIWLHKVEKLQTFGREGGSTWSRFVKTQKYLRGGVERGLLNLLLHSTCKVIYQAFYICASRDLYILYIWLNFGPNGAIFDLFLTVCWLKYDKAISRTVA